MTIPDNSGIRKFIWEHLNDIHRILHHFRCAGATISAKKLFIATPEIIVLGHKCNYEGRVPDDSKIAKIRDWPPCRSITDIHAFLGTAGFMQIWICNSSTTARPLTDLTCKGETFAWDDTHAAAMQVLKDAIVASPALISIDYASDHPVYLAVDSSVRGVGWILSQDCPDGQRHPARFGSISWNERESCYSQAKLELYGLFRALRSMCLYLIGIRNLVMEMDASFICGMLNNPDCQPNTTINRWIAAIHLFDFKLTHVPVEKHHGPDGLSCRAPVEGEDDAEGDPEEWIDRTLSLSLWATSWLPTRSGPLCLLSLSVHSSGDTPAEVFPSATEFRTAEDKVARYLKYLRTLDVTTFPSFTFFYAYLGLFSPNPVHTPRFVSHVTSLSIVILLFIITCRRGSPSSLSRTMTHHAYLLIFLSPMPCTILRPVVAGPSQAFSVFNRS